MYSLKDDWEKNGEKQYKGEYYEAMHDVCIAYIIRKNKDISDNEIEHKMSWMSKNVKERYTTKQFLDTVERELIKMQIEDIIEAHKRRCGNNEKQVWYRNELGIIEQSSLDIESQAIKNYKHIVERGYDTKYILYILYMTCTGDVCALKACEEVAKKLAHDNEVGLRTLCNCNLGYINKYDIDKYIIKMREEYDGMRKTQFSYILADRAGISADDAWKVEKYLEVFDRGKEIEDIYNLSGNIVKIEVLRCLEAKTFRTLTQRREDDITYGLDTIRSVYNDILEHGARKVTQKAIDRYQRIR